MGSLSMAKIQRKGLNPTDSSSPRNCQLSIAPQLGLDILKLLLTPAGMCKWFDLVQVLCYKFISATVRSYSEDSITQYFCSLSSLLTLVSPPLPRWPLSFGKAGSIVAQDSSGLILGTLNSCKSPYQLSTNTIRSFSDKGGENYNLQIKCTHI